LIKVLEVDMPRIVLEHITKRFDKFVAVNDLNLVIEDRDFITLLGPSGCGKTTTLRMVAGLETPTEGRITIGDTVVFDSKEGIDIPASHRDIGFLFQNYALWPHMTVYQNIAFGLENLKWDKSRIKSRVDEMLKMLKIEQFVSRYPAELSGGQQQRVAIARTLAPSPKVLFMDEPLSNLDAKLRLEMRSELKRLHLDTDSTFIYVTHDQMEAMALATKICLMDQGLLQQYEPPLTVYNKPANRFVADFVGNPTMNFLPTTFSRINDYEGEVSLFGETLSFKATDKIPECSSVIVGIRPEFITLGSGRFEGAVYTTLPSGMETTVKLEVGDTFLTSVVFGSVDYHHKTKLSFSFIGNGIVLFDSKSGKCISIGNLS